MTEKRYKLERTGNVNERNFSLKEALQLAAAAAAKLKEAHGQSPQGRRAAIIATDIEKLQALQSAWDI